MSETSPIPVLTAPPEDAPVATGSDGFFAFYSSLYEAIITDARHMQVPVSDHLVHRGDGVFETLKCLDGRIYCLEAHLDRLLDSARQIGLAPPCDREALRHVILATTRAGGHCSCMVRVLLSRGPGGMGVSPAECPQAGLYVLVHAFIAPFMETHPGGAHLVTCDVPVKAGFLATIKTCNYLPNALLKKAALDRGADFAVNFDEEGWLAEGATENIGILDRDGVLRVPAPGRILPGTTMQRACALAATLVGDGALSGVEASNIARSELEQAAEILVFGTTANVTAVTRLDGRPVGDGQPGAVALRLDALLRAEQSGDNDFTTRAFT
jgi:branched-subunit amino acid aminotransferase/4-amino-4-deoxychorismate lyase